MALILTKKIKDQNLFQWYFRFGKNLLEKSFKKTNDLFAPAILIVSKITFRILFMKVHHNQKNFLLLKNNLKIFFVCDDLNFYRKNHVLFLWTILMEFFLHDPLYTLCFVGKVFCGKFFYLFVVNHWIMLYNQLITKLAS